MIMDGVKFEKKKSRVHPISIKLTPTYNLWPFNGYHRGRDHMVVGFTTTFEII